MKLYEKLFEIQKLNISVKKDAKNPFFKSDYVTLDQLVGVLTPLLNDNKLLVIHTNVEKGVLTKVIDVESSDFESSLFMIEGVNDPQKKWSAITYGKRYNLASLFNIISDRDDDAETTFGKCTVCWNRCRPWKKYCSQECLDKSIKDKWIEDKIY